MDSFIGEIRTFAFNKVPRGWHLCDGAILPIQQYTALFSLLSNMYGGDGKTTFGLPDLRGRAMLSSGTYSPGSGQIQYVNGGKDGSEAVAVNSTQVPLHDHAMNANSTPPGSVATPAGNFPATLATPNLYATSPNQQNGMADDAIAATGGGQTHNNIQPSLVLNYCICTQGIYPPRS